jgi:hypothetical protein
MADNITVHQAVANVMRDVIAVRKAERNDHFKFNFRGIDAVMNTVGPVLRQHGVIVVPADMQATYTPVSTSGNKPAMNVQVRNTYRFYGPSGDFFDTVATGESIDNGDKGTAKANSVAFRTCLLQALCLPTDEPDPDSFSPERAAELKKGHRDDIYRRMMDADSVDALRDLWQEANKAGFEDLKTQIQQRTTEMKEGK